MTSKPTLGLAGLSLILATAPATAQEPVAVMGDLRTFCAGDHLRSFAGRDPQDAEVVACFGKTTDQASLGCRTAIAAY